MPLTKQQKELYIQNEYNLCPVCKSEEVEHLNSQNDTPRFYHFFHCRDCGAYWTETFALIDVELDYDYSGEKKCH